MPVSGSGDIAFTGADKSVTGVNHIGLAGSLFVFYSCCCMPKARRSS